MSTEQDRKEKIVAEKQDLAEQNKVSYGKPQEEQNSSEEITMSPENKTKETAPAQKKQFIVVQSSNGGQHALNGKHFIDTLAEAQQHATNLSIQHKIGFQVLSTVYAVQPKANVDVLNIID